MQVRRRLFQLYLRQTMTESKELQSTFTWVGGSLFLINPAIPIMTFRRNQIKRYLQKNTLQILMVNLFFTLGALC